MKLSDLEKLETIVNGKRYVEPTYFCVSRKEAKKLCELANIEFNPDCDGLIKENGFTISVIDKWPE